MFVWIGRGFVVAVGIFVLTATTSVSGLRWCHANVFAGPAHASWRTAFVGDSLTQYWSYPATNLGQAGAVTGQIVDSINAGGLRCRCYRSMVLLAGTNDAIARLDPGQAVRNIDAIVAYGQAHGLHVYVATLPPLGGIYSDRDAAAQTINRGIVLIAHQRHATLLDYRGVTEGHPEFTWDGVHPSNEGYEAFRHVLAQAHVR